MTAVAPNRTLLSPEEIAERYGLKLWTVREGIRQGRIPHVRFGKRGPIRVPVHAFETWLEEESRRSVRTPQEDYVGAFFTGGN